MDAAVVAAGVPADGDRKVAARFMRGGCGGYGGYPVAALRIWGGYRCRRTWGGVRVDTAQGAVPGDIGWVLCRCRHCGYRAGWRLRNGVRGCGGVVVTGYGSECGTAVFPESDGIKNENLLEY